MALNLWSLGCRDDIELIFLTLPAGQSAGILGVLDSVCLSVAEGSQFLTAGFPLYIVFAFYVLVFGVCLFVLLWWLLSACLLRQDHL